MRRTRAPARFRRGPGRICRAPGCRARPGPDRLAAGPQPAVLVRVGTQVQEVLRCNDIRRRDTPSTSTCAAGSATGCGRSTAPQPTSGCAGSSARYPRVCGCCSISLADGVKLTPGGRLPRTVVRAMQAAPPTLVPARPARLHRGRPAPAGGAARSAPRRRAAPAAPWCAHRHPRRR